MLHISSRLCFRKRNLERVIRCGVRRWGQRIVGTGSQRSSVDFHSNWSRIKGQAFAHRIADGESIAIKAGHVGHLNGQFKIHRFANVGWGINGFTVIIINDFFINRRGVCLNIDLRITYDPDQELGCDFTVNNLPGIFHKVGRKVINCGLIVCTSRATFSDSACFQMIANNTRKLIQFCALIVIILHQDISNFFSAIFIDKIGSDTCTSL